MDPAHWHNQIRSWGTTWGFDGLERRVTVSISTRMRTSLGRTVPARGLIRIAKWIADGPQSLLAEVLCHELAHIAVFERYGRSVRPHGKEWAALVREVGFEPRTRLPAPDSQPSDPVRARPTTTYEHRCPVCGARRLAKRPMARWRCARCADEGLAGRVEIRSFPMLVDRGRS